MIFTVILLIFSYLIGIAVQIAQNIRNDEDELPDYFYPVSLPVYQVAIFYLAVLSIIYTMFHKQNGRILAPIKALKITGEKIFLFSFSPVMAGLLLVFYYTLIYNFSIQLYSAVNGEDYIAGGLLFLIISFANALLATYAIITKRFVRNVWEKR